MIQPQFSIVNHTSLDLTRVEIRDKIPSSARIIPKNGSLGQILNIPVRNQRKETLQVPVFGQPRSGNWQIDLFVDSTLASLSLQLSNETCVGTRTIELSGTSAHQHQAYVSSSENSVIVSLSVSEVHRWMQRIPGRSLLSELTIPGTHESCARYGGLDYQCHSRTIGQQLIDGIRFFDIRCRHYKNDLPIHHEAVFQHQYFGPDVLNVCVDFLTQNPSECILMSVKQEYDAADNTESFQQTFQNLIAPVQNFWYLDETIPTLDEVRGKIVLFRRFAPDFQPFGLNLSGNIWKDDATFDVSGPAKLKIQDRYDVYTLCKISEKWKAVKHLINGAVSGDLSTYFLNFTSGAVTFPLNVAEGSPGITGVNDHLARYLLHHADGRFGTFAMDFYDYPARGFLIDMLLAHNP